jgi:RND family efflux transporter MFP subunit
VTFKNQNHIQMKTLKYILIFPLIGLLSSCGSSNETTIKESDPIKVQVGIAKAITSQEVTSVSGRIEAGSSANISTRMMGNVTAVLVTPGAMVKKGDLLITLSSADLSAKMAQVEASIAQAKSGFENAEKDFARFKTLYDKGSASQKELENITTHYEMAKAGLEAARQMENEVKAQFTYSNLRAPFDGVVANTFVKVGDMANPGMPLATVEGISNYEATVMVTESQISKIKLGADATVLVKSSNTTFKGKVREVSPSAKNTGGQFLVKIALEDAQGVLPGMFVNADIALEDANAVASSPFVAQEAVIRNGQLTGIYALSSNDKAVLRWVRLGQEMEGKVEILSGLSENEKYIFKPEGKLFNGAKVITN